MEGILLGWSETGTEGVIWCLYEDGFTGYEGLRVLKDGDRLTVRNPDDSVLWEGEVSLNWEVGYRPYPSNPSRGQQISNNYWCHGIQEGFDPDAWGAMFLHDPPLRTTLEASNGQE